MIRAEACQAIPANPNPTLESLLSVMEEEQHEARTLLVESFFKLTGRTWSEVETSRDDGGLMSHAEWLKLREYDLKLLAKSIFESL